MDATSLPFREKSIYKRKITFIDFIASFFRSCVLGAVFTYKTQSFVHLLGSRHAHTSTHLHAVIKTYQFFTY